MRRTLLLLGAASMLLGVTELMAQAKPSFAGKWTLVPDPAAAAAATAGGGGGGGGGGGARRGGGGGGMMGMGDAPTIAQDANTLTITTTTAAGETKRVYKLDGTDSKNAFAFGARAGGGGGGGGGGAAAAPTEAVSKAKWDASKLVITTSIDFNGNAIESTMALSLDASGNLVVESTNAGRGGTPTTTKTTYKKG